MGNLERLAISALSGEAGPGSGRGPGEPQLLALHHHGDSAVALFAIRGRDGEARALLSYLERSEPEGWQEDALFGFGWFDDFERPGAGPGRPPVEVVGGAEASSSDGVGQRILAGRAAAGLSTVRPEGSGLAHAARVDPRTGSFVVFWPVEPGHQPQQLIAGGPEGEEGAIESRSGEEAVLARDGGLTDSSALRLR